jgi:RNA polymerase sigma-70 factor (ECF subfamily)
MDTTSATLLERVRRPGDPEAWRRFVQLYTPLLYAWACRARLRNQDAADLVQDVFTVLLSRLPEFRYDHTKSFRAWLFTVLRNKWRENGRRHVPAPLDVRDGPLAELVSRDEPDELSETEYRQQLVQRALQLIQNDFQPGTWAAWTEHGVARRPAGEVAAELGLTVRAVYLAKYRVLRRLRQELDGLLD